METPNRKEMLSQAVRFMSAELDGFPPSIPAWQNNRDELSALAEYIQMKLTMIGAVEAITK